MLRAPLGLAALLLAGCGGGPSGAAADDGTVAVGPTPLRVEIRGYDLGDAMEVGLTRDGRYLVFNNSNSPVAETDLQFAERVSDAVFDYRGPIAAANSSELDAVPSQDAAGNLYFVSLRSYGDTMSTVHRIAFAGGATAGEPELVSGLAAPGPFIIIFDAEIAADGSELFFAEGQYAPPAPLPLNADLWVARPSAGGFARAPDSAAQLASINTDALEYAPALSPDGLTLYFTRIDGVPFVANPVIWQATRPAVGAAFGMPTVVPGPEGWVEAAAVSPDGRLLYFHRRDDETDGLFHVYVMAR